MLPTLNKCLAIYYYHCYFYHYFKGDFPGSKSGPAPLSTAACLHSPHLHNEKEASLILTCTNSVNFFSVNFVSAT